MKARLRSGPTEKRINVIEWLGGQCRLCRYGVIHVKWQPVDMIKTILYVSRLVIL